jgi:hypothetical protein
MSTGAECRFTEIEPGRWEYWLQEWPYGEWPEGQTYGPFDSYASASTHLSNYHANPGGHSTQIHKDHRHEDGTIARRNEDGTWNWDLPGCPACRKAKEDWT